MSWSKPLYILSHSKTILHEAIDRDASFLEKNEVMDYSLLVGLNNDDKLLVLGIIGEFSMCSLGLFFNCGFLLQITFEHLLLTSESNRLLSKLESSAARENCQR